MAEQIDVFASKISGILSQFANLTKEALEEAIDETAKEAQKELRSTSPKRTGAYARGWKIENTGNRISPGKTIYNEIPGLAHLLENGHAKRGGGRVEGIPHIAPVDDKIAQMIEEKLRRALG